MLIYKNVNYSFVSRVHKDDYASAGHNCFEFQCERVLVGNTSNENYETGGCGWFFEVYKNL